MPSASQQIPSGASTPNLPENEQERAERTRQQEVDLHLATSMSRGGDLAARSRSLSGGTEMQPDGSEAPYRRHAQAEQDAHFFEGSASPRNRSLMKDQQRTPPSPSTTAARFYNQNRRRTLSDTSVDSQAGFIDHRGSQASMPIRNTGTRGGNERHLSPRDIVRSAARTRSSRLKSEVQDTRNRTTSASEGSGDEHSRDEEDMHADSTDPAGSSFGRTRRGTIVSNLSASKPTSPPERGSHESLSSRRRGSYEMADDEFDEHVLQGSAIANDTVEDEPGVVDHRAHQSSSRRSPIPRDFLHRQSSRRSNNSEPSRHNDHHSDHEEPNTFSPSLSRRPSDVGQVEEDVCYPHLQIREAGMGDRHQSPPRAADSRMAYASRGQMGIPGVLPNFPFPFDFGALEEFCEEERERHGIAIPKAKHAGSEAVPGISVSATSNKAISFSPDSGDGAGMMRRRKNGEGPSRRQRKLSESVSHVGRYQRKLALFEGTSPGQRNDDKAGAADSKTPLLNDQSKRRPGFGATNYRSTNSANEKARPYRFSFYSNALPSTIHARSLAEIPGDDQTFEDLFVGRQESPAPEEWEGSVMDPGEAAGFDHFLPGQKPGSGGQNTPNGGATAPSVASFRQAAAGSGRGSGNNFDTKGRNTVIRSVEDAEANTWWLDVLCPTDAEMKTLGKVFGIHPLTIEDILMEEAREKIELFRNYYFVCFRSFDQDPYSPTYLEPLNMYIIVFREGTLSFHFRGTPHPQNVRRRIKQLKDFINVTSDWISYALIDDITDAFGPLIQNIEYEVDSIDELVLILKDAEQSDMLRRIGTCRKKVMGLLRLMGNKADVVKGLAKRCNENWSVAPKSDIGLYLSDIQDHLITMTQNLNHYEKILSRSHSNYLAQISIEMTDANNQINDVLSKLTALGTVLIPMNLVTGLFGMNVRVPGEGIENLHWFFGITGMLCLFAIAGGYATFRAFAK